MSSKEEKTGGATNVQVAIRCRPPSADERKSSQAMCITNDQDARTVKASYGAPGKKMDKTFSFDKVFGTYSTQEDVFKGVVSPIVQEVLQGFNCTIFAYGQTGTGKTHTMQGDINSEEGAGIVPRAVKAILNQLEAGEAEFTIRVSFLELYNEELQDLLSTAPLMKTIMNGEEKSKLKLCEDAKKGGVVCQGLEEVTVMNVKDIMDILERGIQQRQTAETLCNKNSSRSHSIFTLKINIREYNAEGEEVVRLGQLNLVDLAGSECVGRSGAKNDRAREAGTINQSLLSLGRVITALVDHHSHIPYRDSKLTRLLQDSLGGKAKTCIIATLSPCQSAIEETLSTLDYASRAKNIKNKPQQNEKMTKKTVMKEYCAEIETLRNQLQITREKNGVYVNPEEYHNMVAKIASQENQMLECESALKRTAEETKVLKKEREELNERVTGLGAALNQAQAGLENKTAECKRVKEELGQTQTELKATEAVVIEQTRAEAELTQQGGELLEETAARKNDIAALLAKVDTFAGKENLRTQHTVAFMKELSSTQAALSSNVAQLSSHCEQHATALCDGVAKMLSHGKSSCSSLQTAIDSALQQLSASSRHATDNMSTACDGLDESLQQTNKQIDSTLMTLQSELSKWLSEVDTCVGSANAELNTQKNMITETTAAMNSTLASTIQLMNTFIIDNASLTSTIQASVNSLKSSLTAELQAQEKTTREAAQARALAFETKAAALRQQFLQSMDELLQASKEDTAAMSTLAADQCAASVQMLTDSCDNVSRQVVSLHDGVKDTVGGKLIEAVQGAHKQEMDMLHRIQECGTTASDRCGEIGASVGDRNTHLQQTVTGLVTEVGTAIADNCAVARQTAAEASSLHTKVDDISAALNTSAGASLDQFTALLRNEGDALESELKGHFATVDEVVAEQQNNLLPAIESQKTSFGAAMNASVTVPTGATPTKSQQERLPYNICPMGALAATRSHAEIKQEVYAGSWIEGAAFNPADSARNSLQNGRSLSCTALSDLTMAVDTEAVPSIASSISAPASLRGSRPTSIDPADDNDDSYDEIIDALPVEIVEISTEEDDGESAVPSPATMSTPKPETKKKRKLGALQPKVAAAAAAAVNASPLPADATDEGINKAAKLSPDASRSSADISDTVDIENVPVLTAPVVAAAAVAPTRSTRGARASKIGVPAARKTSASSAASLR